MSYCPKCGAYIPDGDTKCVACGYDTSRPEEKKPEEKTDYSHRYDYGGSAAAQTQTRERREERREQRRERSDYRTDPGFESQQDTGPYASQGGEQRSAPDIDYSDLSPEDDAAVNKSMGILCYIGPLFIVSLLTRRNSRFVRYHANQGLALFLAELAVDMCAAIPGVGWLIGAVGGVCLLLAALSGIMNAAAGVMKPIPFFGSIKIF
jgi:uncharacterized membrane protein/ribosomal protein L40E